MKMKAIFTVALSAAAVTLSAGVYAEGRLETPKDGTAISGKALFSGWHCDATSIEIELPSGTKIPAAMGTTRGDLNSKCGKSDVGFGLLFNMAELGEGEQTIKAYADGVEFATSTFTVTKLSTGNYLSGASKSVEVTDFPKDGHKVTLAWEQTLQNFVIVSEAIPASGGADVLQDGVADSQYDVGIYAFDQMVNNYGACGGPQEFASAECESISFEVVDDEDRGAVLEVAYLTDKFAGIVIDSSSPGLDMSAYETGVLNFDIKVVSAGTNTTYKVKLDDHNIPTGSTGEFDVAADNSGDWATYSVNLSDLLVNVDGNGVGGNLSLNALKAVVFMATFGQVQEVVFRLDNVYFSE
jgi:hypothetical protein